MKLGLDAKRAFHNASGLGNYSRDLIRVLSKVPDLNLHLYNPKKSDLPFVPPKNCTVHYPEKVARLFTSVWRSQLVTYDLVKHGIEVYHGLSNELPEGLEKTGIKSVVTIHDLIFLRYTELYGRIDRKIYDLKFQSACNRADRIVAISEQTKRDLMEFWQIPEEKIEVVYQGCNAIFKKKVEDDTKQKVLKSYGLPEKFLISVGSIEPRKNLKKAIETLALNKDLYLVAIGKHTVYQDEVRLFAEKLGVSGQLKILNKVPTEHLPALMQSSSGMVYLSIFEGFGIPVLEGLHSNIPVITNKDGCFREAGGPLATYVDVQDAQQIAEFMTQAWHGGLNISDDETRRTHLAQFEDEAIRNHMTALYKAVRS